MCVGPAARACVPRPRACLSPRPVQNGSNIPIMRIYTTSQTICIMYERSNLCLVRNPLVSCMKALFFIFIYFFFINFLSSSITLFWIDICLFCLVTSRLSCPVPVCLVLSSPYPPFPPYPLPGGGAGGGCLGRSRGRFLVWGGLWGAARHGGSGVEGPW